MNTVGPFETSRSDYPLTQLRIPERNTQLRYCGNPNLAQRCGVPDRESLHSVESSEGSSRPSPRSPGFEPRPIPARSVVDKLAFGRGFLRALRALRISPSVSLHKVSTLILQLLLSSGQTGKVWEPSNECSGGYREAGRQKKKNPPHFKFSDV